MMFGVRAKVLFLYLAVSFVFIKKANSMQMSTPKNIKLDYNCIYENEEFKIDDPNWSALKEVGELHFEDDNWINFKNQISKIFGDVIENYPLNNVDQFIRFIQAYKQQTGAKKSLETFFTTYNVPWRPLEDPVSILIEINRRLTANYPPVKLHMNIITAYVDPPDSIVNEVRKSYANNLAEIFSSENVSNVYEKHIAGVIKITIGNTKERGIILLDPGYINGNKRVNPYSFVIMENHKSEHNGVRLYGNEYGGIDFTMGPKLVLASGKLTKQDDRNVLYLLNYSPFYSYLNAITSTKKNLLAPNYGIMSFGSKGFPKGYLTFNIVPESISHESSFFKVGTFDKTTESYLEHSWSFNYLKTSSGSKSLIEDFADELFPTLKGDNLFTTLQTIQSEVFEDIDLVKEIYELTNKLNPKKITRKDEIDNTGNLIINNDLEWYHFCDQLSQAFRDVMGRGYSLNNVDQFISFVQAYKRNKNQTGAKKSLEKFFNDYHVPIQPLADPVSFLHEINRRLTEIYPPVKNLLHVVSAYVNPPEQFIKDVLSSRENREMDQVLVKWTKGQFQKHIAGIIKIQTIAWRGIILLDPGYINGYEYVNPYYSISDAEQNTNHFGGPPHGIRESDFVNKYLGNKFGLLSLYPPYNYMENYTKVLYLLYKPICSFMDGTIQGNLLTPNCSFIDSTIIKGNLLAPNHGIMTFDNDGHPKGYLKFNVIPQKVSNKSISFTIGSFRKELPKLLYREQFVTFESMMPDKINTVPSSIRTIKNITENLSLGERNNLLSKLQTLQTQVFEDPELVMEIYELNNKLNNQNWKTRIMSNMQNFFKSKTCL